jgi:ferredoxin/flavodoxin---NADP+ reductase
MDLYDITIIGGGPTGLFGSFYAGLRGLKTKVVDVLPELGGQLTALYPEKYVYDVAGHPKILAKDLAKALATQAQLFKASMVLGEKVLNMERIDENWKIVTDKGGEHYSKTVLLALGAGACVPKKLDVDYDKTMEDCSIFYAVKNKEKFRDKNVLIIGGGDSAVDWANEFSQLAKRVTLIHRRDQFRAVQTSVEEMKRSGVDIKTFYELKQIHANGDSKVDGVTIFDNRTGKEEQLDVDAIIINIGFVINLDFLKAWGLKMETNAITVNEKMETNLPGVYAAGDICTHPAKLKLIATGAAEAATAVNFACTFINPTAKAFPGHSSNLNLSI